MTCQYEDNTMIDVHCKIKIQNDGFEDSYCQTGCPLRELGDDVE